jgi:hypothetical protein
MRLFGSRKSYAMEIATEPLVMASEIFGLEPLHGFIKQENKVVPVLSGSQGSSVDNRRAFSRASSAGRRRLRPGHQSSHRPIQNNVSCADHTFAFRYARRQAPDAPKEALRGMSPRGLNKDRHVFRTYLLLCIQVAISDGIALDATAEPKVACPETQLCCPPRQRHTWRKCSRSKESRPFAQTAHDKDGVTALLSFTSGVATPAAQDLRGGSTQRAGRNVHHYVR